MRLGHLIERLTELELKYGPQLHVDLFIETETPVKCQYQMPLEEIAVDGKGNTVILMYELWKGGDDSQAG